MGKFSSVDANPKIFNDGIDNDNQQRWKFSDGDDNVVRAADNTWVVKASERNITNSQIAKQLKRHSFTDTKFERVFWIVVMLQKIWVLNKI